MNGTNVYLGRVFDLSKEQTQEEQEKIVLSCVAIDENGVDFGFSATSDSYITFTYEEMQGIMSILETHRKERSLIVKKKSTQN